MYNFVERYGCFNADKFKSQDEYSPIMHREHKIQNNCNSITENPDNFHYAGDSGIFFKTCVCNFYDRQISFLIEAEERYNKNNTLPIGVNYLSNRLNNVFNLIRSYKHDWEKAEMEKIKAKNKIRTK